MTLCKYRSPIARSQSVCFNFHFSETFETEMAVSMRLLSDSSVCWPTLALDASVGTLAHLISNVSQHTAVRCTWNHGGVFVMFRVLLRWLQRSKKVVGCGFYSCPRPPLRVCWCGACVKIIEHSKVGFTPIISAISDRPIFVIF